MKNNMQMVVESIAFGMLPYESKLRLINEANEVEKVDDINQWVEQHSDELKWEKCYKFTRINARPAKDGEKVVTYTRSGEIEKEAVANNGDFVVNNVETPDQKYVMKGDVFQRKYEKADKEGVFKPKGGVMLSAVVPHPLDIEQWGKVYTCGRLMKDPNSGEIYGIQNDDFNATYKIGEPVNE